MKCAASQKLNVVDYQQLAAHVLMLRPSTVITTSELQDFAQIVGLSVGVSLVATTLAAAISLPIGTALAIFPFRGRRLIVVLINAFFGLRAVMTPRERRKFSA